MNKLLAAALGAAIVVSSSARALPPQCSDLESTSGDLEAAAESLLQCVQARDYSDDCDSEASQARSAADDYESAVSDAESELNGEANEVCN